MRNFIPKLCVGSCKTILMTVHPSRCLASQKIPIFTDIRVPSTTSNQHMHISVPTLEWLLPTIEWHLRGMSALRACMSVFTFTNILNDEYPQ